MFTATTQQPHAKEIFDALIPADTPQCTCTIVYSVMQHLVTHS